MHQGTAHLIVNQLSLTDKESSLSAGGSILYVLSTDTPTKDGLANAPKKSENL